MTNQRNSSQSNAILSTFSTSKKSLFSAIFFNKNQLNATRRNIGGYPATDQKAGDSNSPGRAIKTRKALRVFSYPVQSGSDRKAFFSQIFLNSRFSPSRPIRKNAIRTARVRHFFAVGNTGDSKGTFFMYISNITFVCNIFIETRRKFSLFAKVRRGFGVFKTNVEFI